MTERMDELEKLLRAAIDRINELEGDLAELQGYQKGAGAVIKSRLDELEARYEKHEHEIEVDGESINVNTVGHVER